MQLAGDRIVAPRHLLVRDILVDETCYLITLDRALFLWAGDTLRLERTTPVVERRDGTIVRPGYSWCTAKWAYTLR
ncbi:hypothetical protein Daura_25655 [Dactylosporangium aurantiacum]|uniref:Uncharacterized protein n=1 Tax=Dactylosporangium aurantiacum TaxID=35754 RepID=A0A9Q9MNE4_9ACTN|nr:hypothetical protein [Dactylosporangium aurantiacum]MDG6108009.1 hypothetical protein [Dactylosporangium aurantiacum]UWZ59246.1 hypothetical protein Daura_25655 [Dactylosporangium aurantiacum]